MCAFQETKTLQELNLMHNDFEEEGAMHIAQALLVSELNCPCIAYFLAKHNNFSHIGTWCCRKMRP